MSPRYDVLIIGNGSIGSFVACDIIRKNPHLRVAVLGHESRKDAASAAAGAMANVFAEVEHPHTSTSRESNRRYLELGIEGSRGWSTFLNEFSRSSDVVTAKDTLVFLKKDASTFETSNFNEMVSVAKEHDVYENFSIGDFNSELPITKNSVESVAKIKGEYALDSARLLLIMDDFLREHKVDLIDASVLRISSGKFVEIETDKGSFDASKVVVAAGSNSANLLKDWEVVPMLQGVGSAYLFKSSKTKIPNIFTSHVIRTVNRGGAQCGFHVVPRKDGFYLGAGNYITLPSESSHRLETLRYLFQTLESELIDKDLSYDLVGSLVKGHRPRSMDGLPMIGPLGDAGNIFVATGTNRAGLTWAPRISQEVLSWLDGNDVNKLFEKWNPDRKLVSFGTKEEAIEYFAESRVGAAIEHKLITMDHDAIEARKVELRVLGEDLLKQTQTRFNSSTFVPHPDHWAPILDTEFSCFI
jgi:glycine/D-amino acid oxidase-like deaminating enzyme